MTSEKERGGGGGESWGGGWKEKKGVIKTYISVIRPERKKITIVLTNSQTH